MLSIQFTDHASEDLDKLITYTLEHWGAEQASAYLDGLEALIEKLAAHPKMGTPSDCLSQNILAFPYPKPHDLLRVRRPITDCSAALTLVNES